MAKVIFETIVADVQIANDVAIATVQILDQETMNFLQASGVSRKHPEDKFSVQVAEKLALGRAFEALGLKLQKRANGMVRNQENIAAQKEKAAKSKKKTPGKVAGGKVTKASKKN